MKERIRALLVHEEAEHLMNLRKRLETDGIVVSQVQTSQQAARILQQGNPPELVFTDLTLPDGTWADVLMNAERAPMPVNVIVVSRLADTKVYIEAVERGAFDYLAPPFESAGFSHVMRCAAWNVKSRRETSRRCEAETARSRDVAASDGGLLIRQ